MAELKPEDVRYIIVHDIGVPQDQTVATIDAGHRARGFSQIGYHWVVRKNGDVEPGRPENLVGAHVAGENLTIQSPNFHSIGVAMTGDQPLADTPRAQRDALVNKVAELCLKYNVSPENVRGHGEVEPGNSDLSHAEMDTFRPLVEARIAEIRLERGLETPAGQTPATPTTPVPPASQTPAPPTAPQPPVAQPPTPPTLATPPFVAGIAAGAIAGAVAGAAVGATSGAPATDATRAGQALSRGATGEAVTAMQRDLKALGLDLGRFGTARDGLDGKFGPVTEAAVRQFEKSHGLPETGVASGATLAAIATAAREAQTATQAAPSAGDGASTPPPHPAAGAFLREADHVVSSLLEGHTTDVPGALDALIRDTRGPGSGALGRTTAEDVQQSLAQATSGSGAVPLSKTEAGMIAGILDERARLVGEGATLAPQPSTGDGASGRSPLDMPVPTASDGAGLAVLPARPEAPTVPSSVLPGGSSTLPGARADADAIGSSLPRQTGQRLPTETGPSL